MPQTIHRGMHCFQKLAAILHDNQFKRLFVVHGKTSLTSSGAKATVDALRGVQVAHFAEVEANPDTGSVTKCARMLDDFGPEVILAVGGGSAIDTAKAAMTLASGVSEADVLANRLDGMHIQPALWAAPTTAGSGSEATHFAVLYKGEVKYSIAHAILKPTLVFLDPGLTISCPPGLSLASGLDATCQAVESYWSRGSTEESRTLSIEALRPLLANVFLAVDEPENLEVRTAMLYAAHLAGKAIDLTKTTAGHAMAYGLTSRYGLPHGVAVLSCMGPLVELMDLKFGHFSIRSALDEAFLSFGASFPEGFARFHSMVISYMRLTLPHSASTEYSKNDTRSAIEQLTSGINVERLSNHPVHLTSGDIAKLYGKILPSIRNIQSRSKSKP